MGQVVADSRQALGLAVARMIRYGLPVHGRAPAWAVRYGPSSSAHSQTVPESRAARMRMRRWRGVCRLRCPRCGPPRFGWLVPAKPWIARIVGLAIEIQPLTKSASRTVG